MLIGAELLVGSYAVVVHSVNLEDLRGSRASAVFGLAVFGAWLFLFLGSPFLVRSQRWLAILGWFVAVASFIFSGPV